MANSFLIVGLGNPGKQYEQTRHNIGFQVLEAFSRRVDIPGKAESRFNAMVGTGRLGGNRLILAQPLTFMNLSGEAVAKLLHFYDLSPAQLMVVYDDVALPFGKIRLRAAGSDAGQKGMKSIIACLGGNQEIARLRVGVGGPPARMAMVDYVLGKFDAQEQKDLPRIIEGAIDALHCWIEQGIEGAMSRYNGLDLMGADA